MGWIWLTMPLIKYSISFEKYGIGNTETLFDLHCFSGKLSSFSNKHCQICCKSSCNTCGTKGCGVNGQKNECCIKHIIKRQKYCNSSLPACILTLPQYCPIPQSTKPNDKTRILIAGLGHSGTSFLQQFIGEVLFNKRDVFFLYEAVHISKISNYAKLYNITINDHDIMNHSSNYVNSVVLSDFFNCKFHPKIDKRYIRGYRGLILKINNLTKLNAAQLTMKCVASKFLIFKEIHFHVFDPNYQMLYNQCPNLKILYIIRNPIYHIPSQKRLSSASTASVTNDVCNQQYIDLQYAIKAKWLATQFKLIKSEQFFANVYDNKSIANYVKDNLQEIMQYIHITVDNKYYAMNDINLDKFNKSIISKFAIMKQHIWKTPGILNPVKKYKKEELRYIKKHCKLFAKFTKYSLWTL